MSTSPSPRLVAAEQAVQDAISGGWPAPGSPFERLIQREGTARFITFIGGLPGVLLDMPYVEQQSHQAGVPADVYAMRRRVQVARQERLAARLAEPQGSPLRPRPALYLSTAALGPLAEQAPDRVRPQVERLLRAREEGWKVRVVTASVLSNMLPSFTRSLVILGGDHEVDAVYHQAEDGAVPHETFDDTSQALTTAVAISRTLPYFAMTAAESAAHLESVYMQAGPAPGLRTQSE